MIENYSKALQLEIRKLFQRFQIAFLVTLIFGIGWLYLFEIPMKPKFEKLFIVLFLLSQLTGIVYLYYLNKLAIKLGKSKFLWSLGVIVIPIMGFIISYLRMRSVTKKIRETS